MNTLLEWVLVHILLLCCLFEWTNSLKVPTSFQGNQKLANLLSKSSNKKSLAAVGPTVPEIIKLLSTYEIDSHFEVVLIGNKFDQRFVSDLSLSLDLLSIVSAGSSVNEFVHEKVVYHVSIGSTILSDIQEALQSASAGVVNPKKISEILRDYHFRASTLSTLFVLHLPDSISEGYSYASSIASCASRSFIASEGFAWIDLTAESFSILPVANVSRILPPLNYNSPSPIETITTNAVEVLDAHQLAADVHRSIEALSPYPVVSTIRDSSSNANSNNNNNNPISYALMDYSQSKQIYAIVVITICSDLEMDRDGVPSSEGLADGPNPLTCKADPDTLSVVKQLVDIYSSQFMQVRIVEIQFDLTTVSISHALHSAANYYPSWNLQSSEIIDSAELLYWLSASTDIQDSLAEVLVSLEDVSSKHSIDLNSVVMLPIFVLRFSEAVNMVLDDQLSLVHKPLSQPPGGWRIPVLEFEGEEEVIKYKPSSSWPTHAIVSLSPIAQTGVQIVTTSSSSSSDSTASGKRGKYSSAINEGALSCRNDQSGVTVLLPSNTAAFNHDELFFAIRKLLWNISPPYEYFSPISQTTVRDYLWYTPSALSEDSLVTEKQFVVSNSNSKDQKHFLNSNRLSFREKRALSRKQLFRSAEAVLHRFATALSDAYALVPPVNITELIEMQVLDKGGNFNSNSNSNDNVKNVKTKSKTSSKKSSRVTSADTKSIGVFDGFLAQMESASVATSHHNFDIAAIHFNNANMYALDLERRIKRIILMRVGTVECVKAEAADNVDESEGENQHDAIDAVLMKKTASTNKFSFASISVVVGGLLGVLLGLVASNKK